MDLLLPKFADWSLRGHELDHSWLDKLADLIRSADCVPQLLQEWPDKYPKLVKWLDETTCALCPAQLFEVTDFDYWPRDFRDEARNWLHERFMQSNATLSKEITELKSKLKNLDIRVRGLISQHHAGIAPRLKNEIADEFDSIVNQLQRVVPREIRLPSPERVLPLVLVIDDILGRRSVKHNGEVVLSPANLKRISEQRRAFCMRFHVLDAEEPANSVDVQDPIGQAYFCPAQHWDPDRGFQNDQEVAAKWMTSRALPIGEQPSWALVVVDVWFDTGKPAEGSRRKPTKFGVTDLIPWLRKQYPELPILALTSESGTEFINRIQSLGVPYLHRSSSSNVDLLTHIVRGGVATSAQLRAAMGLSDQFVAEDSKMLEVVFQAWLAAHDTKRFNILHLGESGVGKEALAEFIHRSSDRATKAIIKVHCGQLTKELADTELFGFYQGAFDGARADTDGFFQQADGGTLFLDEFADLDESCQTKLLRALQREEGPWRVVQPRGQPQRPSKLCTRLNLRVICATDQSLDRVRPALVNRIDVVITIPPLRERPADIVPLARYFIKSPKHIAAPGLELSDDATEYLRNTFGRTELIQGNVRTLRRLLEESVIGKGSRGIVTRSDLDAALQRVRDALILDPPEKPLRPGPPEIEPQVHSAMGDAVAKIMSYIESGSGWDALTQRQIEEFDRILEGHVTEVVGTLMQWAMFRRDNVPSLVRYLTGRELKHRGPEDVIKKLLQFDPRVAEMAAMFSVSQDKSRLKRIIESEAEKWAERKYRQQESSRKKGGSEQ